MALLKSGTRGPEVTALQKQLNALGYHISADGIFGNGTSWAVKDFQRKNDLSPDGMVGPNTLAKINAAASGSSSASGQSGSVILKKGARGSAVQELQALLANHGYDLGSDGVFGWGTDAAVKHFQQSKGLAVDGVVGSGTMAKLKPQAAPAPTPSQPAQPATPLPSPPAGGSKSLTPGDVAAVAGQLGVEAAAVQAVCTVESSGSGFLSNGDPKILFEGHIFWRQLKKQGIDPAPLAAANPDIIYEHWTRSHYKGGIGEYDRLNRAIAINREAALNSASWGMFQIMGFNYKSCGYNSVDNYVSAMYVSEGKHLEAFGKFISSVNLVRFLKVKDWASFAKGYNGPGYATNHYDTKLATAYQQALAG